LSKQLNPFSYLAFEPTAFRFHSPKHICFRNGRRSQVKNGRAETLTINSLSASFLRRRQPDIEAAYITGWRIHDEIFTRQKHHADLKGRGWLRLDPGETKNGEGRNFPFTARLREIIERQFERTKALEKATGRIIPWLFHCEGRPIKTFRRSWLTACVKAGLGTEIRSADGKLIQENRQPDSA
jgi:hypothetical protein